MFIECIQQDLSKRRWNSAGCNARLRCKMDYVEDLLRTNIYPKPPPLFASHTQMVYVHSPSTKHVPGGLPCKELSHRRLQT